jgi:glycosyltransferase involved in cell wall biosynthesis
MSKTKFALVIPSYKNANWYQKNLASVLSQDYSNYRIVYTDDASPDDTGKLVGEYLEKTKQLDRVELHCNDARIGALQNLYNMIHECEDDEVVVTIDGDDWLPHPNVMTRLDTAYQDPEVWMTYGQYRSYPDQRIGCSRQIPTNIIQTGGYRRYRWCSSHLRTFYAWLFKKIPKEDLLDRNGKFYPMAWDLAFMMPMLEMCGTHHRFIKDVLYIYNYDSPINDAKVNLQLQQGLEREIRSKKPYDRIQSAG